MANINTHGRKVNMEDLTKTSEYTKGIGYHGEHVEIFYDKSTGEVWGVYHSNQNEWEVYHDSDVIKVGAVGRYKSPQQIADMIATTMADYDRTECKSAEYLEGGKMA